MHTSIDSRLIRSLLAIVMLNTASGCMTTSLWKWAGETEMTFRSAQGIAGDSRTGRALILRYANESDASSLCIPLQADGRPCPPFDGGEISAASSRPRVLLGSSQVLALIKAAGDLQAFHFDRTFKAEVQSQQFPIDRHPLGVTAIAYRIKPNGDFAWVTIPEPACTAQSTSAKKPIDFTGVNVAVIPDTIPVPLERRQARKTLATVATPFTVVGDAAVAVAAAPVVATFAVYVVVYLIATPREARVMP